MNYYAVLGLKARIYNYTSDATNANKYASEVIQSNAFKFVDPVSISTSNVATKDRLFTTELAFAIRIKDIGKWADGSLGSAYSPYFKTKPDASKRLTLPSANFIDWFEATSNPNDIRYKYLVEVDPADLLSTIYASKYWQTWTPGTGETASSKTRLDQIVPLIRLSEMYYILANNASTIDIGLGYLNVVRSNRGITKTLSSTTINLLVVLT